MDQQPLMKNDTSNYKTLVDKLFTINLHGGAKFGLSNMERASHFLGHPDKTFRSIHIAGTNGKGSVSTKIASNLKSCGLFTSPHIASFRERIKIDGEMISEEEVALLLPQLFDLMPLTFFEITTLLAFLHFRNRVQWGVIETGLGGRLDATNIIKPELSIITSISLEHTEILGNTIDAIGYEKGGIIKEGVPLIVGPRTPPLLKEMADYKKSPYFRIDGNFRNYDEENSAIAKAALEFLKVPTKHVTVRPRCRFEIHGNTVLDVAHNPDGMKELIKMLQLNFPNQKYHFVLAFSKTKDVESCLNILKPHAKSFRFTEADNGRSMKAHELSAFIEGSEAFSNVKEAMYPKEGITVVAGTFFIMRDALIHLGQKIERDDFDMNERSLPK